MDNYPHIATAVSSWLWNEQGSPWACEQAFDFFLFCQEFLAAVNVSPSVVFLGLKYMQRYQSQLACNTSKRQLFAVSIRLAYKYLEDDSLCPQTCSWSSVVQMSALDLFYFEQQYLLTTAYDLSLNDYVEWADCCRSIAASFCISPTLLYNPHAIPLFVPSAEVSAAASLIDGYHHGNNAHTMMTTNIMSLEDEDDDEEDDDDFEENEAYKSPNSFTNSADVHYQEQLYNLTSQPIDDLLSSTSMGSFNNTDSYALAMSTIVLTSSQSNGPCFANYAADGHYGDNQYYCCFQDAVYPSLAPRCNESLLVHPLTCLHDYSFHRLSMDSLLFQPYYYPALPPPLPNSIMAIEDGR
ncbi:hypothetical protein BX666DRAFT_1882362 [Dichotomocladium elegans]|nr:hypothetical protein BX666DRAFT_1882362 [Dichotomocladium elegans]